MSIERKRSLRTAFFISDHTGISVEMLGHSLLSQFEGVDFAEITLPFLNSAAQAATVVRRINECARVDGVRPLVFSTFVDEEIRRVVGSANALHLDCFGIFITSLEAELGLASSHEVGRSHRIDDRADHRARVEAIRYALEHDDGISRTDWQKADVILIGISRTGKTPTCLYLALQYGTRAANYPLVPEDFSRPGLPAQIKDVRNKLFGFTIDPARLHQMRNERKPGSVYASLENCEREVREAEKLMNREGIPYMDATSKSIEELAAAVLHQAKLGRKIY